MKIRDIRHVGLLSPAIAAHTRFYLEAWGLRSAGEDRQVRYFRGASAGHHILSLHPAQRRGLHHLAFSVDGREAVDAAAAEFEREGIALVAHPADLDEPGGGYGLRFLDPENRCIELSAGGSEHSSTVAEHPNGGSEHPNGGSGEHNGPRLLCHVGLNTTRFDQIVAFYTGMLGFRVSDWIEDRMVFLRCGRSHHVIVFSRADHASVNHIAYLMANVDDVMKGVSNLRVRGHEPAWGPGRHGPGNNIFCYYKDPAGYVNELSSDLAHIEDEATHTPAVWRRVPETMDYWGTAGAPGPDVRKAMAGDPDPGWTAMGVVED
ncbi:MAG: VOC family protein [Gemmatimonadetes bacterium]|nr:VOC family protein [Gemmatimonadota bacterium]